MKNFIKKITGVAAKEQALAIEQARVEAEIEDRQRQLEAEEMKLLKKKDPKAYATKKGEPWVSVLDVQVNEEDIRNGFFELDWNDLFILQLRQAGYGEEGDLEEEIVDRWFRDIVFGMLEQEGLDTQRSSGYINVVPISKGKSEVS